MPFDFHDDTVADDYQYGPKRYQNEAFEYMLRRFSKLYRLADFNQSIEKDALQRLIGAVNVQATAKERLDAVLEWVLYDEYHRVRHLPELLPYVPSAVLTTADLKFLSNHHLVHRSSPAKKTVHGMIDMVNRPYYQDRCQLDTALNITSMRDKGGTKLFAYTAIHDRVEFQVKIQSSEKFEHLIVSFYCTNIRMHKKMSLPKTARAHVIFKLCEAGHGKNRKMHVVDYARIEEERLQLVTDGKRLPFHCRLDMHYYPKDMKRLVKNDKKFSLFIQIKEFWVNSFDFIF